jgi:hypothetical protein
MEKTQPLYNLIPMIGTTGFKRLNGEESKFPPQRRRHTRWCARRHREDLLVRLNVGGQ